MTSGANDPLRGSAAAVIAVLAFAQKIGAPITRVKLAKLLYFADLRAVERDIPARSGLTWMWLNFGPYDHELRDIERSLALRHLIQVEQRETWSGQTEYRLRLADRPTVEIDRRFAEIVAEVVEEFGQLDATTLRDFSYQTPPMMEAQKLGTRGVLLDLTVGRRRPNVAPVLARYKAVLAGMQREDDEPGATQELAREIEEFAELRASANRELLD